VYERRSRRDGEKRFLLELLLFPPVVLGIRACPSQL